MIKIAIVEDEAMYAKQLEEFLHQYEKENGEAFDITIYSDGDQIVNKYQSQYDIILMDVEMKFMDGMSAAEEIRKVDTEVVIIFITNMAQYAIRGYAVDALDYVLKPVSYFAFSQRLSRAIRAHEKKRDKDDHGQHERRDGADQYRKYLLYRKPGAYADPAHNSWRL